MGRSFAGPAGGRPSSSSASPASCGCLFGSSYGNSANTLTLPADLAPPRLAASVSGLSGTGAGIGSIVFTYAVGRLADRGSFAPVFVLAGLLPLASLAMLFFVMGRLRRIISE